MYIYIYPPLSVCPITGGGLPLLLHVQRLTKETPPPKRPHPICLPYYWGVVSPYYCMYRDLLRRPPPICLPYYWGWSPPITACTGTY
jgi:hypothetical protein